LILKSCYIDADDFRFRDDIQYKIVEIDLENVGNFSDWSVYPSRLKNLLQAISGVSLTDSLKTLSMKENGIYYREIEKIYKNSGLSHVKFHYF